MPPQQKRKAEEPAAAAAKVPATAASPAAKGRPEAASAASVDAVPGNALRTGEGIVAAASREGAAPAVPDLDTTEGADVLKNLKVLVPYVLYHVKEILKRPEFAQQFSDLLPHLHPPLPIQEEGPQETLRSFKPPWTTELAKVALITTGMFEASGNLLWCCPYPPVSGNAAIIAGEPPSWKDLEDIVSQHFTVEAAQPCHPAATQGGQVIRLTFPTSVAVHVDKTEETQRGAFNGELRVVTGHAYLAAWYVAMFRAIPVASRGDTTLFGSLWQCALTVTLHCRVGLTEAELAVLSIALSETRKTQAKLQADSFLGFAKKALLVCRSSPAASKTKMLNQMGVKFNNSEISKSMMTGILLFEDKISEQSLKILRAIERKHGKEVLTSGYHKLTRLAAVCKEYAVHFRGEGEDLLEYVLEWLDWTLDYDYVAPKDVTTEFLDKARDGTLGAVHMTLARKMIFSLVSTWVEELVELPSAASLAKELQEVLWHFAYYRRYKVKFGDAEAEVPADRSGNGDPANPAASRGQGEKSEDDVVEKFKKEYQNKVSQLLINFLYDLLSFHYDKHLAEGMKDTAVKDICWQDLNGLQALREIHRTLQLHKTAQELQQTGPPVTRELARFASEPSDPQDEEKKKERQAAWKDAQGQRRKFVHVGTSRCATKQQLQTAFEKSSVYNFQGKAGESHRLFIFSAELWGETPTAPWGNSPDLSGADVALSWVCSQTGPTDVVLLCDGRSRTCRKTLEEAAKDSRHLHEEWIIYKPTKRLGRRVVFGADNKEMLLVSMPVPRTQMTTMPRQEYAAAGEETTHEATYTGVPTAPWGSLPVMSKEYKQSIMGMSVDVPKDTLFDSALGLPLFWQERKTVTCWRALMETHNARAVFDVTPGCGAAARAAMDLGVQYACVTRCHEHSSWLQNIVDRQALRNICVSGGPLFHQDLAKCIAAHFQDTMEGLNRMDEAEDEEPEQ